MPIFSRPMLPNGDDRERLQLASPHPLARPGLIADERTQPRGLSVIVPGDLSVKERTKCEPSALLRGNLAVCLPNRVVRTEFPDFGHSFLGLDLDPGHAEITGEGLFISFGGGPLPSEELAFWITSA